MADLNFFNVLNSWSKRYKQMTGGRFKVRCLNPNGHKKGDRHPSLVLTEASDHHHAGYYCFVCKISGSLWDFTGLMMGLTGYQGNEIEIRDELTRRGLIRPDSTKAKSIFTNPHAVRQKPRPYYCYDELLLTFKLNDAILLSTIHYFINRNERRCGKDFVNCSIKKLREKWLPCFSAITLSRSIRFFRDKEPTGVLMIISNHRTTIWRIDQAAFVGLMEKGTPKNSLLKTSVDLDHQNDRTGKPKICLISIGNRLHESASQITKKLTLTSANYPADISRIIRAAKV